eukprot:gene21883-24814_t
MSCARIVRLGVRFQGVALKRHQFSHRSIPALNLQQTVRHFSNEDFRETLKKIKEGHEKKVQDETEAKPDGAEGETSDAAKETAGEETKTESEPQASKFQLPKFDFHAIKNWTLDSYDSLVDNVRGAYSEMIGESKESHLTRKVHQAESFRRAKPTDEEEEDEDLTDAERAAKEAKAREEAGPSAIVLVKDPKSAWESMRERLADSPLIREMMKNSRKIGQQAASTDIGKTAVNATKAVQDKIEDAKEFWETSQNPLVYTISGVWDSLTGETEEGIAVAEIRKYDPKFVKELWAEEVKTNLVPQIIKAHLAGNTSALKPWLGEAVYNKLAADIRTRKHDGIVFDTNILDIDENQILVRFLENNAPVIVVVYMVQQINCIRNRKGEIIEGGETDIHAKFYSMAFQQNYDEDDGTVTWKIVDYQFAGDIPYF